jgi:glycosyltransferase involved in cell wall biosynthesis
VAVIPHPVFPGPVRHEDDGATILFLGLIRPYKQLDHALEVARALGARLIVLGEPMTALGDRLAQPGVDWRLGYAGDEAIETALAEATLAVFPYRSEIDQSGALLRALGGGVPAVAYDAGGIGEPVERFTAGAVVARDDVAALTEAVWTLLSDGVALARARAGALRARETLSWDAAAGAHLELYQSLF